MVLLKKLTEEFNTKYLELRKSNFFPLSVKNGENPHTWLLGAAHIICILTM
jgi:hypothetical protein